MSIKTFNMGKHKDLLIKIMEKEFWQISWEEMLERYKNKDPIKDKTKKPKGSK